MHEPVTIPINREIMAMLWQTLDYNSEILAHGIQWRLDQMLRDIKEQPVAHPTEQMIALLKIMEECLRDFRQGLEEDKRQLALEI